MIAHISNGATRQRRNFNFLVIFGHLVRIWMLENGITSDDCGMGGIVFLSVLEDINTLFSIHGDIAKYRVLSLCSFLSRSVKF